MSVTNENLLFITESRNKQEPLKSYLCKQPYTVKTLLESDLTIVQELASANYSAVIFSLSVLNRCHIELMSLIQQTVPKPVAVFAEQCDDEQMKKAINVGANSIVVAEIKESRINNIINIAKARFQRCMALHKELNNTKQKLEERKDVDRAKGILMKKKKVDEEQAYTMLRKIAMNKNQRIGEVSRTLILAAELLD